MTTHARLVLDRKLSTLWHHINPDMARLGQRWAFDEADVIHEDGADIVEIYDRDEMYLATSRCGRDWERMVSGEDRGE